MNADTKPVGPVDVTSWLADVKAGKKAPRTAPVEIFLAPELADEYDALVDRFNALVEASNADSEQSLAESPDDHAAELDAIEQQMEDLKARAESSKTTFTFRTYRPGDQAAIAAKMQELGLKTTDSEELAVVGTAQYCESPVLDYDTVKAMIPIIGWVQYNKLCDAWQTLVYGVPTGPKLLRPLRSRGTSKP